MLIVERKFIIDTAVDGTVTTVIEPDRDFKLVGIELVVGRDFSKALELHACTRMGG